MAILTLNNEATELYPKGYGYLYNWYAVVNANNISNTGWSVPQDTDFQALVAYLGGESGSGGKLKETGTTYWLTPNTGATNEVGFNARGAGERRTGFPGDQFFYIQEWLRCWTSSEWDAGRASIGGLARYSSTQSYTFSTIASKYYGQSVRLLKDSTTLSDGETSTYVGNDGKTYTTICIGTQEWIAGNLAETKYRDGSDIPNITDQVVWNSDSVGGRCAYDNDENNV